MLGTGTTQIKHPIGLLDIRTNGVFSGASGTPSSQKWLNSLLAPTIEVDAVASYYASWWKHIFAAMDANPLVTTSPVNCATFLCGDKGAIDSALKSWRSLPKSRNRSVQDYFYEMDVSGIVDKWGVSMLVGATPGYIGYKEEGSLLIQKIKQINELQDAYDKRAKGDVYAKWDRPVPVLVFTNVHRAAPEGQAILASIAHGSITSADGVEYKLSGAQIVFTAPGIHPLATESVSGKVVITGLSELRSGSEKMFATELLDAVVPINFAEPTVKDLLATASCILGRECLKHFVAIANQVKTTQRHYADPGLVHELLRATEITTGMSWTEMTSRLATTAPSIISGQFSEEVAGIKHDVPSLQMGTLWCRSTNGKVVPMTVDINEIEVLRGLFTLPADFVERSGVQVSPSAYWGDLAGVGAKVKQVVLGQDPVIDNLLAKMQARSTGAPAPAPLISAMLVGPTGSGKTALPLAISQCTGHPSVVINCNSISSESLLHEALFGQEEGSLYTTLRRNPATIVILDEVDKAPQSIWARLMTALDTGEIRDASTGQKVCLRHAMVFMTSNYLAKELRTVASQLVEMQRGELDATLRNMLTHCAGVNEACIERLDGVYLMMPLEGSTATGLWKKLFLDRLQKRYGNIGVSQMVAGWAESRHLDHGGAAGARARIRSVDDLIASLGTGPLAVVHSNNGMELVLTQEANAAFMASGGVRSERQRLWAFPENAMMKLRENYRGNSWQVNSLMETLSIASRKVSPRGPVGVALLCGPTGGGKTYLGDQLSRLFGKGEAVKIECQQAVSSSAVSTMLFGDSAGNGGSLTAPLTLKKDRVVIFDEFTRAHKSFMDQVMNVLDEGRALDTKTGLPVDMRQSLFVLTTNACADEIDQQVVKKGLHGVEAEDVCRKILVAAGVLLPEHAERMGLILPITRQESEDESRDFVSGIIRGVLAEFGLNGDRVAEFTEDCLRAGVAPQGARAVRRWAEKRIPAGSAQTTLN